MLQSNTKDFTKVVRWERDHWNGEWQEDTGGSWVTYSAYAGLLKEYILIKQALETLEK